MIARHAFHIAILALILGSLAVSPTAASGVQNPGFSLGQLPLMQDGSDDLDCEDFDYQEDAQEILDADPTDPNALDPNQDGIACALLPYRETPDVADVEIAQDAEADRAARQAEREERRNNRAQEGAGESADETVVEETISVTCDNFATQEDAQAAFDIDPAGLAALDADGNGLACEELPAAEVVDTPVADETREERQNRRNQNQDNAQPAEEAIAEPVVSTVREDLDCIDFQFQEEAQSILDREINDPFNLDPNGDGFACSSLPSATPQIVQVPRTGTGARSRLPMLEFGSLAIFAGMALIAAVLTRRQTQTEDF